MSKYSRLPLLFAKGAAMGAADVVPGVSGGTIAFISGIYDELIDSIKSINFSAVKTLFRDGPAACWRQINGTFLAVLFAGILTSILTLARLVSYLLDSQPVLVWSFFFGLILASVIYIFRQQPHWRPPQVAGFVAGTAAALFVAFSPPLAVAITPVTVLLAGMLAICAMILPGVSGSFILLLIGVYPVIIDAISAMELGVLAVFAIGAALGLLAFSRVLSWLLHRHRATTLSVLLGFLAGSLTIVWPWQDVAIAAGDWHRQLLLPGRYETLFGSARTLAAVSLMAAGLVLVLGLEAWGQRTAGRKK